MGSQNHTQGAFADRLGLSIVEAAQFMGVGRSTVYRLIGDGSIPAKKVGARTVILREDVINFLRSAPVASDLAVV